MSPIENNKKYWANSHYDIFGGKATILQTKASGGFWQFRCFISSENKYVRKSLKTKDKETAIERAEREYLDIHSSIKSGKKLFGMRLSELVSEYIEYREKHVGSGVITEGRLGTIKSQLNHFLQYKGKNTKISELERKSIFEYQYFRKEKKAQDITIRNEQSTINAMIKWGYENNLCDIPKFEFDKIRIREVGRRDIFTSDEYHNLYMYLRSWSSKKRNKDEKIRFEKLLIRDYILILANTFLRVGEARQLRWNDIISMDHRNTKVDLDNNISLVYLKVRAETSKNRKNRDVITRGGKYFSRLKNRVKPSDLKDFVFSEVDGSLMFSKKKMYNYWHEIMNDLGFDYKIRNLSYYSLRHFGITSRLKEGVSIWDVSKIAGTGVAYIEQHYGHSTHEMMEKAAFKRNI